MFADGPSVEIMTHFYLKLDYLVLQIYFNGELMALLATPVTLSASTTVLNVCGNKEKEFVENTACS